MKHTCGKLEFRSQGTVRAYESDMQMYFEGNLYEDDHWTHCST